MVQWCNEATTFRIHHFGRAIRGEQKGRKSGLVHRFQQEASTNLAWFTLPETDITLENWWLEY